MTCPSGIWYDTQSGPSWPVFAISMCRKQNDKLLALQQSFERSGEWGKRMSTMPYDPTSTLQSHLAELDGEEHEESEVSVAGDDVDPLAEIKTALGVGSEKPWYMIDPEVSWESGQRSLGT